MWRDDKFQGGGSSGANNPQQSTTSTSTAPTAAQPVLQPQPKPTTKDDSVAKALDAERHAAQNKDGKVYRLAWTEFAKALGKKLVAADGAKLMLERNENGSLRETIEHPEGASLSVTFVPLGERLGTVKDATGKVIATFRLRNRTLSAAFEDGRVETISANGSDGVRTYLRRISAPAVSTEWYPEGRSPQSAKNDPPQRQAQQQPAADDPPGPAAKISSVRSIEIRAGAPAAERRARAGTFRLSTRARPAPTEKPEAFAFSAPRPGHRPERFAFYPRRHADESRDALVIRPHPLLAQAIESQSDLETLKVQPIAPEFQRRIALALRHRERRHEQLAASSAPEYKPASDTALKAPPPPVVAQRGGKRLARSAQAVIDTPTNQVPPSQSQVTGHVAQRVARDDTAAGGSSIHLLAPQTSTKVATPRLRPVAQADDIANGSSTHPTISAPRPPSVAQVTLPESKAPVVVAAAQQPHAALPARHVSANPPADPASTQTVVQTQPTKTAPAVVPPPRMVTVPKRTDESADVSKSNVSPVQQTAQMQSSDKVASTPPTPRSVSVPKQTADTADKTSQGAPSVAPGPPVPVPSASVTQRLAVAPKREDKRDTTVAALEPAPSIAPPVQAPPTAGVPPALHTIGAGPAPRRSASDCLLVESDGTHWGFRNRCPADIQFSYCLLNSSDRLTSCSVGAVAGSVSGNGFSALVADSSIKDPRANRAFRWVGCVGGAGEVSPRLDRIDPPMGRCLHSGELPQGIERADVTVHRR